MHRYFIVVPIPQLLRIWLGHLHKGKQDHDCEYALLISMQAAICAKTDWQVAAMILQNCTIAIRLASTC